MKLRQVKALLARTAREAGRAGYVRGFAAGRADVFAVLKAAGAAPSHTDLAPISRGTDAELTAAPDSPHPQLLAAMLVVAEQHAVNGTDGADDLDRLAALADDPDALQAILDAPEAVKAWDEDVELAEELLAGMESAG